MKFTICNMCERKIYERQIIYIAQKKSFCSEYCLFRAMGIEECVLTEEDCTEDDAQ